VSADVESKVDMVNTVTIAATTADHILTNNVNAALVTAEPYQIYLPLISRDG
jgi:hypothetical protein